MTHKYIIIFHKSGVNSDHEIWPSANSSSHSHVKELNFIFTLKSKISFDQSEI